MSLICDFQTSLGFRQHQTTFRKLNSSLIYWNLKKVRRAFVWRPVGRWTHRVERCVAYGYGWESFGKTCSAGRVGVAIKAAETNFEGGLEVVCIRELVMLICEVDVTRRSTVLGVLFISSALFGLPGSFTWRRRMSLFSSSLVWVDMGCSRLLGGWEGESWMHLSQPLFICWWYTKLYREKLVHRTSR